MGTKWKQLNTCAPARCHQAGMHQNQKEKEEEEEWVRTGRNLEKHPGKVLPALLKWLCMVMQWKNIAEEEIGGKQKTLIQDFPGFFILNISPSGAKLNLQLKYETNL